MHVVECMLIGADCVTLPPKVLWQLGSHPPQRLLHLGAHLSLARLRQRPDLGFRAKRLIEDRSGIETKAMPSPSRTVSYAASEY